MSLRIPARLLRLRGWAKLTSFEQDVLAATYSIPKGQTRSYKQVAQMAGYPRAFRAVGSVMRKNPYAPLVPCHRVIKSDGSLGRFGGGTKKKEQMLRKEGALKDRHWPYA
ncbi:MAG: MGMT family protein [Candidatus Marsarchaeota archaeon]|nr:MGMT family protein [Candidatus Marsarchaeota archaeon]